MIAAWISGQRAGKGRYRRDSYICNGSPVTVMALNSAGTGSGILRWKEQGEAVSVSVVGTQAPAVSSFRCSNPVLNWLYDAYIRTQAANFHNCIPSDCPHREKLGYTGDGQLTSETAMLTMDTRRLYGKMVSGYIDSQGSRHGTYSPYRAPLWAAAEGQRLGLRRLCCAFGLLAGLRRFFSAGKGYPAILRWLEYMESRCEKGLVIRKRKAAGAWESGVRRKRNRKSCRKHL